MAYVAAQHRQDRLGAFAARDEQGCAIAVVTAVPDGADDLARSLFGRLQAGLPVQELSLDESVDGIELAWWQPSFGFREDDLRRIDPTEAALDPFAALSRRALAEDLPPMIHAVSDAMGGDGAPVRILLLTPGDDIGTRSTEGIGRVVRDIAIGGVDILHCRGAERVPPGWFGTASAVIGVGWDSSEEAFARTARTLLRTGGLGIAVSVERPSSFARRTGLRTSLSGSGRVLGAGDPLLAVLDGPSDCRGRTAAMLRDENGSERRIGQARL